MEKQSDKPADTCSGLEKELSSPTHIGPSVKMKGELSSRERVVIKGRFQGRIDSEDHDLLIEEEAVVEADLHGKNITIKGRVKGNVTATGSIVIGEKAEMVGDIHGPRVSIQNGAKFRGSIRMLP